ncbi:hypothetical protein SAMN05444273_102531 [Litoreibacter ascidiaceicola]|uniref:Uncharacterized protein n=1 Tax=Litoreibacter ascidiaceicola TaxID=1486859 RepID=A0A1M4W7U8_9RHOB|nr:hypothetical protein [Litoreibacter ascidiaceicola]SHE77279.1 hypothetical protein SAMN05444273_102531 [Litoreibacter ascidiaceicola]
MSWFKRNAEGIEAGAAIVTACVAVIALIGVKVQLDEADRIAAATSAREAYRSHLTLSVSHPDFAAPVDACALMEGNTAGAYRAFVDHLLYSAEQMLEVSEGWEATFTDALMPHQAAICAVGQHLGETDAMSTLLNQFRAANCPATPSC